MRGIRRGAGAIGRAVRDYCPSDYQAGDEDDPRSPWFIDHDEDDLEEEDSGE